MTDLAWTNVTVALGDLKPWAHNPRFSTKAQAKRLLQSWKDLGQFQTVAIGPECEVYDGHQRLSALLTIHPPDYEIDARQSNRALTDEERQKLVITAHVGAVGSWDWDKLSGWNAPQLQEWGMDADALRAWNSDAGNLREMLGAARATDDFDFGGLPNEDRAPFQQMTFTLHDMQAEQVAQALTVSKSIGPFVDSPNENSNGNALARICETFIAEHGNG